MRYRYLFALLLASTVCAQDDSQLLAPEIIRLTRSMKDIYQEAATLTPVLTRLISEGPTWDKDRLGREFAVLWGAAKEETSPVAQATFYKTATLLFLNTNHGGELALNHLNDVLDAIEGGSEIRRISLVEHPSRIRILDIPEPTIARMAKMATSIQPFPGSLLLQIAAGSNAASPSIIDAVRGLLSKPVGDKYMLYGGYIGGASGQLSNPTVREMLKEIAERADNKAIQDSAREILKAQPR